MALGDTTTRVQNAWLEQFLYHSQTDDVLVSTPRRLWNRGSLAVGGASQQLIATFAVTTPDIFYIDDAILIDSASMAVGTESVESLANSPVINGGGLFITQSNAAGTLGPFVELTATGLVVQFEASPLGAVPPNSFVVPAQPFFLLMRDIDSSPYLKAAGGAFPTPLSISMRIYGNVPAAQTITYTGLVKYRRLSGLNAEG